MNSDSSKTFFKLEKVLAFPGALHGLAQPTVIGVIKYRAKFPAIAEKLDKPLVQLIGSCLTSASVPPENLIGGKIKPPVGRQLQLLQNIADLASALQLNSGHPVSRGIILKTDKSDIFQIAVPYYIRESGQAAIRLAVELVQRAIQQILDKKVSSETASEDMKLRIEKFRKIHQELAPVVGSLQIIRCAERRSIPWIALVGGIVQLGYGARSKRIYGTFTDKTNNLSARIARNKPMASELLRSAGIPVPAQLPARNKEGALKAANRIGYPVVLKPVALDGGIGVHAGLMDDEAVAAAFEKARKMNREFLIERHIEGEDFRLLVLNGKFVSAVRRTPGGVTGDGQHTISELVDIANEDPRRGYTKDKLVKLSLDEEAAELLSEAGKEPDSVLDKGVFLAIRRRANLNAGGLPESVNKIIHQDNCLLAERATRIVGLDISGVDFLTTDISKSWKETGGAICEVNGQPVLRAHWYADSGDYISDQIVANLFPKGRNGRLPIVAVTGTSGSSVTCHMLHRIVLDIGIKCGVSTTRGTWVGEDNISIEQTAGNVGGKMLLLDTAVQAVIIEMPLKSLLPFGFPFDYCSVAGITDIQDENGGKGGKNGADTKAALKSSVLARAMGSVVLNADNPRCVKAGQPSPSDRKILVSLKDDNPIIRDHILSGGIGIVVSDVDGKLQICRVDSEGSQPVVAVSEIPACGAERDETNVFNSIFATALAIGLKIPLNAIASGLKKFDKIPE